MTRETRTVWGMWVTEVRRQASAASSLMPLRIGHEAREHLLRLAVTDASLTVRAALYQGSALCTPASSNSSNLTTALRCSCPPNSSARLT